MLSTNQQLRKTQITYFALMGGTVLTSIILLIYKQFQLELGVNLKSTLFIITLIATVAMIIISSIIKANKLEAIPKNSSPVKKAEHYSKAKILQCMLLENAALLGIIVTFLENRWVTLLLSLILVYQMFLERPTEQDFMEKTSTSFTELKQINAK